jgi:hypothetical protein
LDISRKTVHKVIAQYEAALSCPDPEVSLESVLTIQPRYNSSKRVRRVITGSLGVFMMCCTLVTVVAFAQRQLRIVQASADKNIRD